MTRRALVLDCDGVLADTELDGHLVAFNRAFEEALLPFRWSTEEYAGLLKIGGGKERLTAYLDAHQELDLGDEQARAALVRELHGRKSTAYVELVQAGALPARPGIRRLIGEALDAGWLVAVASTSAVPSVEAVLRSAVRPEDYARISGVFAGDVVPQKKPAPDIYLLAARELGLGREAIVVVEDSEAGAAAATAAGFRHVVTVSSFTADDPFPHASVVLTHLGDPDTPAAVRAGTDVLGEGMVTVGSLDRVLRLPAPAGS